MMELLNLADSSFMMTATLLVFLMTPALAMFYGGLVNDKNVVSTYMYVFAAIVVVSIHWVLFGYSLAFGNDIGGVIGDLSYIGFNHVDFLPNTDYASNIPHILFALFQMKFAVITPAIIAGAFVGRMRFPAYIIFLLIWVTFIYVPLAHWFWGTQGWLRELGALDFAGGNVIHISSGIAGLVAAIVIGKRRNRRDATPNNIPLVVLGTGLLWFGWFGFNAGSALGLNGVAFEAFLCTNSAAATGVAAWMLIEWLRNKKVTMIGAVSGALVGLVAITPAAGYVSTVNSMVIGLFAGVICYFAVNVLKKKFSYDDTLDVFGCHGVGGIWGGIATGLFANKAINPAGADGLFYGNAEQLVIQVVAIVVTILFVAVGTYVILKVVNVVSRLRASEEEEDFGLDFSYHGK